MDIFICDDNTLICNEINSLVSEFFRTNNMTMPVFHTFTDGKSLLSSNVRPDIVFLDIQMPELSGIDVGNILHNKYPDAIIIVITSFMDYLDDAMRFNVFRYISKPIDKDRLFHNMQDAVTAYNNRSSTLYVKCGSDYKLINQHDIIMVEASLKQTIIYTTNGNFRTYQSFSEIKEKLAHNYFYQCHRSFVINLNYVVSHNSHNIYLNSNLSADVAARKYSDFKEHYAAYVNSHV